MTIEQALKADKNELSEEETRKFLTHFAFKIDQSLFGLPLASPSKRGFALIIDLIIVAFLSEVSGGILALAVAFTLYYLSSQNKAKKQGKIKGLKRRTTLRYIASFMLFIFVIDTIPSFIGDKNDGTKESIVNINDTALTLTETISLSAATYSVLEKVSSSECDVLGCWTNELNSAAIDMAEISYESGVEITAEQRNETILNLLEKTDLSQVEKQQVAVSMEKSYEDKRLALVNESIPQKRVTKNSIAEGEKILNKSPVVVLGEESKVIALDEIEEAPKYSIIALIKGIINDLGLGFGWAMFYFTVFIALGNGQTLGKKILGIKVLQLDGTPLSLWDSFGRYGGYGAGIATGLLGFIQIYWDANRQAIHDQISATVVIDLRKKSLKPNNKIASYEKEHSVEDEKTESN